MSSTQPIFFVTSSCHCDNTLSHTLRTELVFTACSGPIRSITGASRWWRAPRRRDGGRPGRRRRRVSAAANTAPHGPPSAGCGAGGSRSEQRQRRQHADVLDAPSQQRLRGRQPPLCSAGQNWSTLRYKMSTRGLAARTIHEYALYMLCDGMRLPDGRCVASYMSGLSRFQTLSIVQWPDRVRGDMENCSGHEAIQLRCWIIAATVLFQAPALDVQQKFACLCLSRKPRALRFAWHHVQLLLREDSQR